MEIPSPPTPLPQTCPVPSPHHRIPFQLPSPLSSLSLSLLPSILRRRFDTKCWVLVSASARYPAWAPPQRITRMSPPPPAPFRAPSPSTSRRSTSHRSGPAAASAAADLSSFPAIPLAADPAPTTLTTTTTKTIISKLLSFSQVITHKS